jgi:hypothetical protein
MTEQFENAFEQWLRNHRYTADQQTIVKIGQRVHENLEKLGGVVAAASFERAYLELVSSGSIRPFKGTVTDHVAAEAPAGIPQDVIHFIEHGSAFEQRRRYSNDPVFKKQYDAYATQQLKEKIAAESGERPLSVEDYRKLPAAQVAQRYHKDRGFRAQVDALIAQGLIALILAVVSGVCL